MSFDLLSEPIRKFIRDKGWDTLRPIQNAAIIKIIGSDNNYILASRTASGKTEAAFLPILSKLDFLETGVQVLYISPLIALINDQFYRVEELCKYLDVSVTKWHGEASKSLKNRLLKHPSGIVLITPESLEAMFVNKPFNVNHLFSNLKYVVIDEVHSFVGNDRGIQLKSILSRLQKINSSSFSIIGLSATIGDYDEVKKITGDELKTKVLLDKTSKDIEVIFRYFKATTPDLPLDLIKDLYDKTYDKKVLIFPNSRGRAEEVAVKLKKISSILKGHSFYFSHHSSIDREVREYIEYFAKNNTRENFCISCTSTLELGIDIGSVDSVVQIDATNSISSLIQRVGRSGRKAGEISKLYLYATNSWSLLQSIACWLLYKEGFIEPPNVKNKPYDILVHQALSITKEKSGVKTTDLLKLLKENAAFCKIEISEINEILDYLIKIDFLEKIQNDVIIGIEGEKIVNNREFYSVFKTDVYLKVVNAGITIGEIPLSYQLLSDQNIMLSAKIWKITFIDIYAKKIEVIPALDGKKPIFYGGDFNIDKSIRVKMYEILYSDSMYDFLDEQSEIEIEILRRDFSHFNISDLTLERPLLISEKYIKFFTFSGTRTNLTFQLLFDILDIKNIIIDISSSFLLETSKLEFYRKWNTLPSILNEIDSHIELYLQKNPNLLKFSKWGEYLPLDYKIKLLKDTYFDFEETLKIINTISIVENLED
jgi:ATP-dependent Lhr-like helicase